MKSSHSVNFPAGVKLSALIVAALLALTFGIPVGFCQPEALPVTYEAEDASLTGVEVNDHHPGYTGSGYAVQFGQAGDLIAFTISVPRQDYYTLRFRFLNGDRTPAVRTLLVDGNIAPGSTRFRNQYAFTDDSGVQWLTVDESLRLTSGEHTVTLSFQSENDQGDVLIDHLQVLDQTRPSMTSTRSLMMNNWTDMVGIHHSAILAPDDDTDFGPRLAAIHWRGDWPTNQIDGATAYFRDETSGRTYTDVHSFDSDLYFTENGLMHVDYLNYGEEALPVAITKQYAMVPDEPILLARYRLKNLSGGIRTISLMEMVDLGPKDNSGQQISTTWYPDLNAWIADMSKSNGTWLVLGTFGPVTSHAAGLPAEGEKMGKDSDLLGQFENQGILQNNEEIGGGDMLMAITRSASISAGESTEITFYYSVQSSLSNATAVAQQVRNGGDPQFWFDQTEEAWQQWLESGRSTVDTGDPGVDRAYTMNLVLLRHSQQPEFGSFVASTNPAYSYSVWPRDASISALSFDAAGYYDEAEKYWMWMAEAQEEGQVDFEGKTYLEEMPAGTWFTNYSYWAQDQKIDFIQPEWDSVGQFLIGVYHHWRLLNGKDSAAGQFLEDIYPYVIDSAQWIAENVQPEPEGGVGFGPPGYSVWEEDFEYTVYTQVTYASGLNAARLLAREMGENDRAQGWLETARTIRKNVLQQVDSEPCGGLWNAGGEYFIRGILAPAATDSGECEPRDLVDGSTDLIWVFGLMAADDPRAQSHRLKILDVLSPPYQLPLDEDALGEFEPEVDFGMGLSRYVGDTFYYTSGANPGGKYESTVPMPSWPWMSSYMSMAEHWLGMDELAFARLQWYVSVTGAGFMPTGEAVDWNTQQPLVSTMSQPDDGGYNMQIALLNYLGHFDPRLPPIDQGGTQGE